MWIEKLKKYLEKKKDIMGVIEREKTLWIITSREKVSYIKWIQEHVGVSSMTIMYWKNGRKPSLKKAHKISQLTSGCVSVADIRPDIAEMIK